MPYTVYPARCRPLPTKRISAGVPVRPWISSTPARPPRNRKSACLIIDCVLTRSFTVTTRVWCKSLSARFRRFAVGTPVDAGSACQFRFHLLRQRAEIGAAGGAFLQQRHHLAHVARGSRTG